MGIYISTSSCIYILLLLSGTELLNKKKEKKEERGNGKINQKLTKLLPKGREVISERNRCGS